MIEGSPKKKFAMTDLKDVGMVAVYIAGSVFASEIIEQLSQFDFGEYQFVVAGLLNIAAVAVKNFFKDTRVEVPEGSNV